MLTDSIYQQQILIFADALFRIRWTNAGIDQLGLRVINDTPVGTVCQDIPCKQLLTLPASWKGPVGFEKSDGYNQKFNCEVSPVFDHRQELSGWMIQLLPIQQIGAPELPEVSSIWIIDDDSVISYITQRLILSIAPDLEIREFLSAKMALEKLRIDKKTPDLILLDINMPGMTGWAVLDQLSTLHEDVAVYMYSSSIDPDDARKAKAYKCVREFLPKPIDNKTIQRLLKQIPGKQRKAV